MAYVVLRNVVNNVINIFIYFIFNKDGAIDGMFLDWR